MRVTTVVQLEEDENGDLVLPLSEEICKMIDLKIGDQVVWTDNENGTFTLTKKENKNK